MTKKTSHNVQKGNRTVKSLPCKECGAPVPKVDMEAIAATCWKCVSRLCGARDISSLEELEKLTKS
jgi:uncharacterized paraquat-inducible protein A